MPSAQTFRIFEAARTYAIDALTATLSKHRSAIYDSRCVSADATSGRNEAAGGMRGQCPRPSRKLRDRAHRSDQLRRERAAPPPVIFSHGRGPRPRTSASRYRAQMRSRILFNYF
ncbi:hypothetical protein EVAR_8122_1 [Eumeta japonica]|uniref:Uncharacterized protein n=1 Tax=Eumeta variegata TaxID=151549 RepID=A0A4C1TSR0_EUMVA|nr:hypothetical protein EVAR_8122_1 [Eumeta japonica]